MPGKKRKATSSCAAWGPDYTLSKTRSFIYTFKGVLTPTTAKLPFIGCCLTPLHVSSICNVTPCICNVTLLCVYCDTNTGIVKSHNYAKPINIQLMLSFNYIHNDKKMKPYLLNLNHHSKFELSYTYDHCVYSLRYCRRADLFKKNVPKKSSSTLSLIGFDSKRLIMGTDVLSQFS